MKRLAILIVAVTLGVSSAFAAGKNTSSNIGFIGGISVNQFGTNWSEFIQDNKSSSLAGWHAGLTWKWKLPLYFSLQPAIMYEQQRSKVVLDSSGTGQVYTHNLVIPLAVQWGFDLGLFRPFVQLVPYANFNLGGGYFDGADNWNDFKVATERYIKVAQFGMGVGGGIEVGFVQVSARYNWSLGDWKTAISNNPFKNMNDRKQGFTISLALLF